MALAPIAGGIGALVADAIAEIAENGRGFDPKDNWLVEYKNSQKETYITDTPYSPNKGPVTRSRTRVIIPSRPVKPPRGETALDVFGVNPTDLSNMLLDTYSRTITLTETKKKPKGGYFKKTNNRYQYMNMYRHSRKTKNI